MEREGGGGRVGEGREREGEREGGGERMRGNRD